MHWKNKMIFLQQRLRETKKLMVLVPCVYIHAILSWLKISDAYDIDWVIYEMLVKHQVLINIHQTKMLLQAVCVVAALERLGLNQS